ncbi:hypothetical protein BV898_10341 [Hypsibius exemplaris]|uniref:Troponin I n=1 Tax=Hypsibius exemplaris TaxID=2072580 RepID=A0A1W0WJX0_HYPEX|nr:hypothetical protein BV898_10341 [Hypsibius exemplaris]
MSLLLGTRKPEGGQVLVTDRNAVLKRSAAPKSAAQIAVRKQLEESIVRSKKPRFHIDAERRKKLKALLLKHTADNIKEYHEKKAKERRNFLTEIIGKDSHSGVEDADRLEEVCRAYHQRIRQLHQENYDLECSARANDYLINEMTIQVNELRGKFVKPTLRSVAAALASETKSSAESKVLARSFRRSLKVRTNNDSPLTVREDSGWRTAIDKSRPEWIKQTSRKSDFDDISEQDI